MFNVCVLQLEGHGCGRHCLGRGLERIIDVDLVLAVQTFCRHYHDQFNLVIVGIKYSSPL